MLYSSREQGVVWLGGFVEPPPIEEIEFRELLSPGAMVRICHRPECPLARVMVMIHAGEAGLLECARAVFNVITGDWEYLRRTQHPIGQALIMEVAAVPDGSAKPTLILFEGANGLWRVTAQSGREVRVARADAAYNARCLVRICGKAAQLGA